MESISLLEAIDRPIRPLVFEMNRIGLNTIFSCCGFHYDGEEEKKNHALYPYVIFNTEDMTILKDFISIIRKHLGHWNIQLDSQRWVLAFEKQLVQSQKRYWAGKEKIHTYEHQTIGIYRLTNHLKTMYPDKRSINIIDGNEWYNQNIPEWKVKAKPPVTLTLKE